MGVLVVEDDPFLAELIRQVVSSLGEAEIWVCTARGPALNLLRDQAPTLTISDLNLPDGSGLDVIRAAARAAPDSRRILITSSIDRQTVLAARQAGITDFIAKPFTIEVLLKRLGNPAHPAQAGDGAQTSAATDPDAFLQQRLKQNLALPWTTPEAREEAVALQGGENARQIIQLARREPLLTTALLTAANREAGQGYACAGLEQAVEQLGRPQCIALVQRLGKTRQALESPALQALARALGEQQAALARSLTRLAARQTLAVEPMRAAVSLCRVGELAVLGALQNYLDYGQPLDDGLSGELMQRHAAAFGNQLKARLQLPFLLRELTGALFRLPQGSMRTDQVVMRIAALETGLADDPQQLQQLRSWIGLR